MTLTVANTPRLGAPRAATEKVERLLPCVS